MTQCAALKGRGRAERACDRCPLLGKQATTSASYAGQRWCLEAVSFYCAMSGSGTGGSGGGGGGSGPPPKLSPAGGTRGMRQRAAVAPAASSGALSVGGSSGRGANGPVRPRALSGSDAVTTLDVNHAKAAEVYGFAGWMVSAIAYITCLVWALVPVHYFDEIGVTYYPSQYWAVALPGWLVMLVVFVFSGYVLVNMINTAPLDSMDTMTDPMARPPAVLRHRRGDIDNDGVYAAATPEISDLPLELVNRLMFQKRERPGERLHSQTSMQTSTDEDFAQLSAGATVSSRRAPSSLSGEASFDDGGVTGLGNGGVARRPAHRRTRSLRDLASGRVSDPLSSLSDWEAVGETRDASLPHSGEGTLGRRSRISALGSLSAGGRRSSSMPRLAQLGAGSVSTTGRPSVVNSRPTAPTARASPPGSSSGSGGDGAAQAARSKSPSAFVIGTPTA